VAAQIIRRILVDHARGNKAEKRGADAVKLSLDEAMAVPEERQVDLAFDEGSGGRPAEELFIQARRPLSAKHWDRVPLRSDATVEGKTYTGMRC
jgi:ECF sigma factor